MVFLVNTLLPFIKKKYALLRIAVSYFHIRAWAVAVARKEFMDFKIILNFNRIKFVYPKERGYF